MRNLFLILIILMSCISCKRKFTCEVTSSDMFSGKIVGKETYVIIETTRSKAMETCKLEHGASIPEVVKTFEIK